MPSVTYMNQSAPFWDFIASLEQGGSQNQNRNEDSNNESSEHPPPPPFGPWGWSHGMPFRGPPPHEEQSGEKDKDAEKPGEYNEKEGEKDGEKENDNGEGPSGSGSDSETCPSGRRCGRRGKGRCGEGRRGRHAWGPRGHCGGPGRHGHHGPPPPPPFGFGPFGPRPHHGPHHGPHHERGHGGRGGWGGPWGGRGGFNPWAFAANWLNPDNYATKEGGENADFSPEADIFDTPTAYVVHISLPGAKKEDVGVNWDTEKSELSIAGVVYRPGDEDFLKTLAMDERKVGPFERKIRLGTRVNPAQIDAEGISAKLEDGVLRVEVPKRLEEGFVEVRKVDIE